MRPTYTDTVEGRGQPVELPPVPAALPPALSPAQQRVTDWEEEANAESRRQLPAPRTISFVPSLQERLQIQAAALASPDQHLTADLTPSAVVESKTLGGHQDRARAWLKYAMPLSVTMAGVSTIAAVALDRVPLLSFWTLLIFGLTFALTYAGLLRKYWQHTPEGVALENVRGLWGHYRREQAHRHGIESKLADMQIDAYRRQEDRRGR